MLCFSFFCNSAYADATIVSCVSYEKVNSYNMNWVGVATDWLFASERSEVELQRREEILTMLMQAKQDDSYVSKSINAIRCIQQQFQINDMDIVDMYIHPEQYERVWLNCSICTTESLSLLGGVSQTDGLWIDRGCGRSIEYIDFGKEEIYDGEIYAGEEKKVYILGIIKKDKISISDFHPKISLLVQNKRDGVQGEYEINFCKTKKQTYEDELFSITDFQVEERKLPDSVIMDIISNGVSSPKEKDFLLLHYSQFDCYRLSIKFYTESKHKWWNPKLEIQSVSSDVIFATKYYGESAYFSDSNQVGIYFFRPKNCRKEIVCDIWLLTETNVYETDASGLGYAFGPQQKFYLDRITLLP